MALSVVSIMFDIILIFQHYIIYMGNPIPELHPQQTEENQQLITSGRFNSNSYHSVNVDAIQNNDAINPDFSSAYQNGTIS